MLQGSKLKELFKQDLTKKILKEMLQNEFVSWRGVQCQWRYCTNFQNGQRSRPSYDRGTIRAKFIFYFLFMFRIHFFIPVNQQLKSTSVVILDWRTKLFPLNEKDKWKMMEKDNREEKARKLLKKKNDWGKNRTEKENESLDLEKENGLGWKKNI